MLAYTHYSYDNRVRRYAEALSSRGDDVDVVALKSSEDQDDYYELNGVHVHRIQTRIGNEKGKFDFIKRLGLFLFRSFFFLSKRQLGRPYQLIHIHNMPDFLVLSAIIPKLFGTKIIFDIHDLFPEFYVSKFHGKTNSFVYKLLIYFEKISVNLADHTIIANHIWEEKLKNRTRKGHKITTILNYPDPKLFSVNRTRKDNTFIMVYPGSLNEHQGLDIAVKAIPLVLNTIPNVEFYIYGGGPSKSSLLELVHELSLEKIVLFKESLPLHDIVEPIANADLGIVPKLADSFGNEAFSTKILEFMALGVPVVVSNTKIDKYYFTDDQVRFFESGNYEELASEVIDLYFDQNARKNLIYEGYKFIEMNNWDTKKFEYLDLIDKL